MSTDLSAANAIISNRDDRAGTWGDYATREEWEAAAMAAMGRPRRPRNYAARTNREFSRQGRKETRRRLTRGMLRQWAETCTPCDMPGEPGRGYGYALFALIFAAGAESVALD